MKTIPRRRRENKTDYGKRLKLLKSGKPRVVFRRTNKYLLAQYIESHEAKDRVVIGLSSALLLTHGWPKTKVGSLKSIPAAYLLGFLMGKHIQEKKLSTPILDFGLQRVLARSKPQAFIRGLVDSGLTIAHKKKMLASDDRVNAKHIDGLDIPSIKSNLTRA